MSSLRYYSILAFQDITEYMEKSKEIIELGMTSTTTTNDNNMFTCIAP